MVRGTDQIHVSWSLSVLYVGLGWVVRGTDQIYWSLSAVSGCLGCVVRGTNQISWSLDPDWVVRGTHQISWSLSDVSGPGWVVIGTDQISWSLSDVFGPWLSGYRHWPNFLVSQWCTWALTEWLEALTKYLGLWVLYLSHDWVVIGTDQISWSLIAVSGPWLSG